MRPHKKSLEFLRAPESFWEVIRIHESSEGNNQRHMRASAILNLRLATSTLQVLLLLRPRNGSPRRHCH